MKQLGIIAALPAEARCLAVRDKGWGGILSAAISSPQPLADNVLLMISGIGQQQATRAAQVLIAHGSDALLSWGCAGALSSTLKSGDLLLPRTINTEATDHFATDRAWHARLCRNLFDSDFPCTETLFSSTNLMAEPAQKQRLHQESGAVAVDMESAAIAMAAQHAQLPFMVIRTIVDDSDTTIPASINSAMDHYGHVHYARLLRNPFAWLQLIQLGRQFHAARSTLTRVAALSAPDFLVDSSALSR